MRTTYFFSFICAELLNNKAIPAVARASTHLQRYLEMRRYLVVRRYLEMRACRRRKTLWTEDDLQTSAQGHGHQRPIRNVQTTAEWLRQPACQLTAVAPAAGQARSQWRRQLIRKALEKSLHRYRYGKRDGVGKSAVFRKLDGVARSFLAP